jgi:hypothetical protein
MMVIDPDYARIYTKARILGWQYGWAVVIHGSCTRDLDLLMVPWEKHCFAESAEQVLKMLAEGENLRFRDGVVDPIYKAKIDWTEKPFGRKSTTLFFRAFGDPRWVDISVCPHVMPVEDPCSGD